MNFNRPLGLNFGFPKLLRIPFFLALATALLALYGATAGSPGTAFAAISSQGQQGHEFSGTASIDGQPAPQGTVVAVLDSGTQIASVSVDSTGQYSNLVVPAAGIFVTFTVDGLAAAETATTQAGASTTLDLNATRPQAPTPTSTLAPTNTPGPSPTPPVSIQEAFRQGPTVRLRPVNDVIDQNKDGIVEVLFRNPVLNETVMVVDLTVSVPAGIHIYGEGYAQSSAAGAASNTYRVVPGQSQTVKLFVKSEKVGRYTIDFSSVYWPEGNKDLNNPVSLTHPFDVRSPSPDPFSATPTDSSEQPIAPEPTVAPVAPQPVQQQDGDPSASCSLSPDGTGSGAELSLLVMPLAGVVGMLAIRRRRD